MSEWKPIETAPKDFVLFLAADRHGEVWPCCMDNAGNIIGIGQAVLSIAYDVAKGATLWAPIKRPPVSP